MGDAAKGLTTKELVKELLFVTEGSLDGLIENLIRQVTDEIEQGIQRKIVVREYTDVLDGSSFTELVLKHRPVIKLLSLVLIDTAVDTDTFELNANAGLLVRVTSGLSTSWSDGTRNYTAIYTAGYEDIPAGIEGIATDVVARRTFAASKKKIGLETEALAGGGSTTFESRDITGKEWSKLHNWGARA